MCQGSTPIFSALQMRKLQHSEAKQHCLVDFGLEPKCSDVRAKLLPPQSQSTFLGGQTFVYKKGKLVSDVEPKKWLYNDKSVRKPRTLR